MSAETQKQYRLTKDQLTVQLIKLAYQMGLNDAKAGREPIRMIDLQTVEQLKYKLFVEMPTRLY